MATDAYERSNTMVGFVAERSHVAYQEVESCHDSSYVKEVNLCPPLVSSKSDCRNERLSADFNLKPESDSNDIFGEHDTSYGLRPRNCTEFDELLKAGRDELLNSSILSLTHLSDEKIVSLMQLIEGSGNSCRSPCRPKLFAKPVVLKLPVPYFGMVMSRMKEFVGMYKLLDGCQISMYPITRLWSSRSRSVIVEPEMHPLMSEAVAGVLAKRYLADLYHLALPPCNVSIIAKALMVGKVSKLQHLELEGPKCKSRISYPRSKSLQKLLESGLLSCLHTLRLSRCIEPNAMASLAQAIEMGRMPRLRHLDLSHNFLLGKPGIGSFVTMIHSSGGMVSKLEHLNVQNCGVNDHGLRSIANAMVEQARLQQGPSKLRYLNLGSNEVRDEGFRALVRIIRAGLIPDLQELHLLYNYGIGEEGHMATAKLLEEGKLAELRVLYMSTHSLTVRTAEALLAAYKNNAELTVELLGIVWPTESIEREVARFRERNVGTMAGDRKVLQNS